MQSLGRRLIGATNTLAAGRVRVSSDVLVLRRLMFHTRRLRAAPKLAGESNAQRATRHESNTEI